MKLYYSPSVNRRLLLTVTICIGFASTECLLLASDSQMSMGSKYKQCNEPKLHSIRLSAEQWAILAIAGSLDGARMFQETFESEAFGVELKNERTISDLADSVLKNTRVRILDSVDHPSLTSVERENHLADLNFEGIIAFYFRSRPHFYTIELRRALTVRSQRPFETIGSGSDIAGFVLTGAELSRFHSESAIGFAAYAIESCKRFDQACGGPLQILVLSETGASHPWAPSAELLREISENVQRTSDRMHGEIADHVVFDMGKFSKKLADALAEHTKTK